MALDGNEQRKDTALDDFTIFVAPGIDTINGPVVLKDLAAHENVHIIVAEATESDRVTARLAETGSDTEIIYRGEVVVLLRGLTRLQPNQVIFAPLSLVEEPVTVDSAASEVFTWNGIDRSALRAKPITVPDYVPGLDRLEANLGFGPWTPRVEFEEAGDGDTFVRVNGKALFRLQGVAPGEVVPSDVIVNRV